MAMLTMMVMRMTVMMMIEITMNDGGVDLHWLSADDDGVMMNCYT